jgi:imidazolonepropionase
MNDIDIVHAKQLITLAGPSRARRGAEMRELRIIADGAVSLRDGKVAWTGPTDQLPAKARETFDASGQVILPGFVDSHTHAVFVRPRADEFEWRIEGTPYMDILARGGGILSSVRAVRDSANLGVRFADRFFEYGTTTIEAKSGYGLNRDDEIRMLEAMQIEQRLEVVPTYLGAHALPAEYKDTRDVFIRQVIADLEIVRSRNLAEFCDVFVEPGAFTIAEGRQIFARAKELGLHIKMHADEFKSSEGAALAAEVGAISADHLGAITDDGIQRLANSGVIATLLPSTLFMLGETHYAPARKLIDSGAAVALASDFNPGTSPTLNMQFVMTLACTQMRMTPAEAICAATKNGAAALRRADRLGSIEPGKQADFAVFAVDDYREIPYYAAVNFCVATFKRGILSYAKDCGVRSELQ